MPTPIEDEFILMWRACSCDAIAPFRAVAKYVLARPSARRGTTPFGCGVWAGALLMQRATVNDPWELTPRGADLLATADAIGYSPPTPIDKLNETLKRMAEPLPIQDCPDCKDGTIGIPVEYAANGGVVRVWPATCTTCNGTQQIAAEVKADACERSDESVTGDDCGTWVHEISAMRALLHEAFANATSVASRVRYADGRNVGIVTYGTVKRADLDDTFGLADEGQHTVWFKLQSARAGMWRFPVITAVRLAD